MMYSARLFRYLNTMTTVTITVTPITSNATTATTPPIITAVLSEVVAVAVEN